MITAMPMTRGPRRVGHTIFMGLLMGFRGFFMLEFVKIGILFSNNEAFGNQI